MDWLIAVGTAFGAIFVAELGDKTQLLALGYGARHSLRIVIAGLALGYATAGAIAAIVGGLLGATLPDRPIGIAAGLLFIAFAVMTLRGDEGDGDECPARTGRHAVLSIAATIALGEMGDKTQLATAALAAQSNPVAAWVGATAGELAAGTLGAVAGRRIGTRLDARILRFVSAAIFAVFGIAMLWFALT